MFVAIQSRSVGKGINIFDHESLGNNSSDGDDANDATNPIAHQLMMKDPSSMRLMVAHVHDDNSLPLLLGHRRRLPSPPERDFNIIDFITSEYGCFCIGIFNVIAIFLLSQQQYGGI